MNKKGQNKKTSNFPLELSPIFVVAFYMPVSYALTNHLTDDRLDRKLPRCRVGDVVRVQPLGYRLGPWKTCAIHWLTRLKIRGVCTKRGGWGVETTRVPKYP